MKLHYRYVLFCGNVLTAQSVAASTGLQQNQQHLVVCVIHTAGCESAPRVPVCLQEGAAMRLSSKCPAQGTCRSTRSRTRSSSLRPLAAGDQGTHTLCQHPKPRWLAWEG